MPMQPPLRLIKRRLGARAPIGLLVVALAGCAAGPDPHPAGAAGPSHPGANATQTARAQASTPDIYRPAGPKGPAVQVIRTGRYRLVSTGTTDGQRNLLDQIVQINVPDNMRLSVADGLKHALMDSGFSLCRRDRAGHVFDQPLPAVQRQLGPTTLSEALQVLAGPAWRLDANPVKRTVCFALRGRGGSNGANTPNTIPVAAPGNDSARPRVAQGDSHNHE